MSGILLLLLHTLTGLGVLNAFKYKEKITVQLCVAVIIGILITSFVPFLLQLCSISITETNVFGLSIALMLIAHIPTLFLWRKGQLKTVYATPNLSDFKLTLSEIPFIIFLGRLYYISFLRSFTIPTNVRDVLSGPETLANYALKEGSLINSVFNIDLFSTNNQYKSPFLLDLQVVYKMAGFEFGGLWLGFLNLAFIIVLYIFLRRMIHPFLAGLLMFVMATVPELYAYSFLPLFDYPNMILWFLGCYYLSQYTKLKSLNLMYLSIFFYGLSVWVRSETLILAFMMMPAMILIDWDKKSNIFKHVIALAVVSFIMYYVPTELYNNHYLPTDYKIDTLINKDIFNLTPLWDRISEIRNVLFTGAVEERTWMNFFKWTPYIVAVDIIWMAYKIYKKNKEGMESWLFWLYSSAVICIGLPIMGFLMPLMNVEHSTKRSFFKLFPLMLCLLAAGPCFRFIHQLILKFTDTKTATEDSKA